MIRLRIKEVAQSKGYNMSSLSRASDVSFTTVKRLWTKPYTSANIATLERLAEALQVEIGDLIERIDEREQTTDAAKKRKTR